MRCLVRRPQAFPKDSDCPATTRQTETLNSIRSRINGPRLLPLTLHPCFVPACPLAGFKPHAFWPTSWPSETPRCPRPEVLSGAPQRTAWPEKQNENRAADVGRPPQMMAGTWAAFGKPVTDAVEPTRAIRRTDCRKLCEEAWGGLMRPLTTSPSHSGVRGARVTTRDAA